MYITDTTEQVLVFMEKLEHKNDLEKIKFLIYLFGLLNNNQINDKNETNPDLLDDDLEIFHLNEIGMSYNSEIILLQSFITIYNFMVKGNKAYLDNSNVIGMKYNTEDKKLISKFEKLNYNEKIDVISEIIIKYDNDTLFNNNPSYITLDSKLNGFDIARNIQKKKII